MRMTTWTLVITAVLAGAAIGLGSFTFVYAKGHSYLTSNPAACANCHIMDEHYAAWLKSSHRAVAGCNDCHTPHDLVGKWATKAKNGFWHSFYFTTGRYPYPLRITSANREIVEAACRDCHEQMNAWVAIPDAPGEVHQASSDTTAISCTRCHRYVGHWVR